MIISNNEMEQRIHNEKMKKYIMGLVIGIIFTLLSAIIFNIIW